MIMIDGMTAITIEEAIITTMTYMTMIITQVGDGEASGDINIGGQEDHYGETLALETDIPTIDLVGGVHIKTMILIMIMIIFIVVITDLTEDINLTSLVT